MSEQTDSDEIARLQKELGAAYRAISGLNQIVSGNRNEQNRQTILAYHQLTIGAAIRFIKEGSLEGSQYFIGKSVTVLQKYLNKD